MQRSRGIYLNGVVHIAIEVILRKRKLRIKIIYTQIWWWCGYFGWRPGFPIPQAEMFEDPFILGLNTSNSLLCIDETTFL